MTGTDPAKVVAIIGGGPAGLIAAEVLGRAGLAVTIYDRMPTVGRKLLMAGRGGLNLTHSEGFEPFLSRYRPAATPLRRWIESFPPSALRDWAEGLGQPTFVGSSGRVFPVAMKASPLLRAWTERLRSHGTRIITRARWLGWNDVGALMLRLDDGTIETVTPDATLLALGGASWPKLGSDGNWVAALEARGVAVAQLLPSNCGFTADWSQVFRARFAGQPLKNVVLSFGSQSLAGEAMITDTGLEGGAVYALSAALRDTILETGRAVLTIDLRPDISLAQLTESLSQPRRGQSLSTRLRKSAGLSPLAINLMREVSGNDLPPTAAGLATQIKSLPVTLIGIGALDRAISTAGGIKFSETDEHLMLRQLPGVFVAGEMLDWEAPTGGYLLQATMATGVAAAQGIIRWLGLTRS